MADRPEPHVFTPEQTLLGPGPCWCGLDEGSTVHIQPLPTPADARAAAADGMARAARHVDPEWADAVRRIIGDLAVTGRDFTADDIHPRLDALGVTTHDTRALGPIMNAAARAGLIVQVGATKSVRRNRALIPIWRGAGD